MYLGNKAKGVIKTIGSKFLQFGANFIGSKGNIKHALGKTIGQTIMGKLHF